MAILLGSSSLLSPVSRGDEPWTDSQPVERGRQAMTGSSFIDPAWGLDAYEKARPHLPAGTPDPRTDAEEYQRAFNARYGLNPAPYPNDGLPMGLRRATDASGRVGMSLDCLVCHGGSIGGQSHVGLGNTQLDIEALLSDLAEADGQPVPRFLLFRMNTVRGNNNAGQLAVFLLSLRQAKDLSKRRFPLITGTQIPELDTPAWWLLKKKQTKYYDGRTPAHATRSNMQFMLGEATLERFQELEPVFEDVDAYLRSLEPPKYPFPIDQAKAERGRTVFSRECSTCHGTYGERWTYPNKVVPLEVIGTDPERATGLTDAYIRHYNATWFGQQHPVDLKMVGYQAPPLDGIWATAPYLHNGSVPTLENLLDSSGRPDLYRRPPSTGFEHYDTERVGWKVEVLDETPENLSREERARIFDTSRWGLGNGGHMFGDGLSEPERSEVIEYLKTL